MLRAKCGLDAAAMTMLIQEATILSVCLVLSIVFVVMTAMPMSSEGT